MFLENRSYKPPTEKSESRQSGGPLGLLESKYIVNYVVLWERNFSSVI
jgi:hypothetical protein